MFEKTVGNHAVFDKTDGGHAVFVKTVGLHGDVKVEDNLALTSFFQDLCDG